jgi:hypothetical protein
LSNDLPRGYDIAPRAYLRAILAVAGTTQPGEYLVGHFGAGSFLRTDRLGAVTARALTAGKSGAEAMRTVEEMEPGAGDRARILICLLGATGAMTLERPSRGTISLRAGASYAASVGVGAISKSVRLAPTSMLRWLFQIWPHTPIARHVWRSSKLTTLTNLTMGGYGNRSREWLLEVGRRSASEPSRNYLFNYLSLTLPPERLPRLVGQLFDQGSIEEFARLMRLAGPAVGVFLHGPLIAAVPNAMRSRGVDVVRVVVSSTHGMNVSKDTPSLGGFFGEVEGATVDESDRGAPINLLRHLKAGRSVYVALDKLLGQATRSAVAEVGWLGQQVPRNDAPAWLAVRSGCPVVLCTTHNSPTGVVITASPPLYPGSSGPAGTRVAELSIRLHALAEAAVRERPEAWACWTYAGVFSSGAASGGVGVDSLRVAPEALA